MFNAAGAFLTSESAPAKGGNATMQYNSAQPLKDYVVDITSQAFNAGTGAFTLNVSFELYPSLITGTRGDDIVYVRSSPVDPAITQIFVNEPLIGLPTYAIPRAAWPTLTFNTLAGNDSLTVDLSHGNPIPSDGIIYDGGTGADTLAVIGRGAGTGSYTPHAATPGSGEVIAEGSSIKFSNLEPVAVSAFSSFTFVTPNSSDNLVIDSAAANTNRISGTSGGVAFESLTFSGIPTVIIDVAMKDAPGSKDVITVKAPGMVATGLVRLAVNAGTGLNYFDLLAGSATLDTNLGIGGLDLNVTTYATSQLSLPASQTLASLSINDSSKVVLLPGGGKVLRTSGLSIPTLGTLDLYDNDMIVKNGNVGAIGGWIKSARNAGAWNGKGVTSSTAKVTPYTGLAAVLNNKGDGTTIQNPFAGVSVGVTDVLVKYTWDGDANLDGLVNADDYFLADSGYITQAKGYQNGDFNYDGVINADDYFLIDSAYIGQSGPLAASKPEPAVSADVAVQQKAKKADPDGVLSQLFSTEPVL